MALNVVHKWQFSMAKTQTMIFFFFVVNQDVSNKAIRASAGGEYKSNCDLKMESQTEVWLWKIVTPQADVGQLAHNFYAYE